MGKKKLAHKWGEIDDEDNIVYSKKKSPLMFSVENSTVLNSNSSVTIEELKSLIEEELLILEETNPIAGTYTDGYTEGLKAVYLYIKNFIAGE